MRYESAARVVGVGGRTRAAGVGVEQWWWGAGGLSIPGVISGA